MFQVWGTVPGRGPQSSSLWSIWATPTKGPPKWWVLPFESLDINTIQYLSCICSTLPLVLRSYIRRVLLFHLRLLNLSVASHSAVWLTLLPYISCLPLWGVIGSVEARKERHFCPLCEDRKLSGFAASAKCSVPHVMRAWYVLLFPFFLFALQCHLVCQDQQAQHPVPLRPTTPDPATLCSQGANTPKSKTWHDSLLCRKFLHFSFSFIFIHLLV